MISILIPVYNFDVTRLVKDLYLQALELKEPFEFIIIDDASDKQYCDKNKTIEEYENVQYIELEQNIGRSKIRNRLAEMAKYDYLLFMDCDSQVVNRQYLKSYIEKCKGETVVCGGRLYLPEKPNDSSLQLRWKYGVYRESTPANVRNENPYRSFMTNNFMIAKSVFNILSFDENLSGYGHEDTLFGLELKHLNIPIIHIDNQLYHIGLEPASEFLHKTEQGLKNLLLLLEIKTEFKKDLIEDIKILNVFNTIRKGRMTKLMIVLFNAFRKMLLSNLHGSNPSLKIFDFYKLGYLCRYSQSTNK